MSFREILLILRNVFVPDLWRFVNMAIAVKNRKSLVSVLSVICHDYLPEFGTQKFVLPEFRYHFVSSLRNLQTFVVSSLPLRFVIRHFISRKICHTCGGRNRCAAPGERIHGVASAGCISSNWCNNCPSIADNIPRGFSVVDADRPS